MKTFLVYNLDTGLPSQLGKRLRQSGRVLKRQRKQTFAPKI